MEIIDHPRLADCPQSFRVAVARLMLVWFWASWDGAGDEQREGAAENGPGQRNERYGFAGTHDVTCAVSSAMRSSC